MMKIPHKILKIQILKGSAAGLLSDMSTFKLYLDSSRQASVPCAEQRMAWHATAAYQLRMMQGREHFQAIAGSSR